VAKDGRLLKDVLGEILAPMFPRTDGDANAEPRDRLGKPIEIGAVVRPLRFGMAGSGKVSIIRDGLVGILAADSPLCPDGYVWLRFDECEVVS